MVPRPPDDTAIIGDAAKRLKDSYSGEVEELANMTGRKEYVRTLTTIGRVVDDQEQSQQRQNKRDGKGDRDEHHIHKRSWGLLLLRLFLEKCRNGRCPRLHQSRFYLYCLCDISLRGYILYTAYEHRQKGEGVDPVSSYLEAAESIRTVLTCGLPPEIDPSLLLEDSRQILPETGLPWAYEGARRRKAYWGYMERTEGHRQDYERACEFIRDLHELSLKSRNQCREIDVIAAKSLLEKNFHIANALDLYRLCAMRKNWLAHSRRSTKR
ncbi:MAG: hypothetical protein AB1646_25805 [Thermodesulfobacteriota bacterium]